MKKILSLILVSALTLGLAACGSGSEQSSDGDSPENAGAETEPEKTDITLWTYPVGGWDNPTLVSNLITDFSREYPEYTVKVKCLDYETGDAKIEEAIDSGGLPDLVLEGPERLVANWGERGRMVDLSDLWESETASQIYEPVRNACRHRSGKYYEFPLCMTAHCMAINYDMFREAGALQYIDEETRTWTADGFAQAVNALKAHGQETAGIIYCGGQGGDQGTRALINNLYGGSFANADHTGYIFNSAENIRALEFLGSLDGIRYDPDSQGTEEIGKFVSGELAMAFCWNASIEIGQTVNNPDLGFDIFPMAFPTDTGKPTLQGGIWGLGIFDNGDDARIEAAKKFIEYMTTDDTEYSKAVMLANYWPVRDMPGLYENDDLMTEYGIFTQYMGDYYQVSPGWADVRTAWWTMLRNIGAGQDIAGAAAEFDEAANSAAKAAMAADSEKD